MFIAAPTFLDPAALAANSASVKLAPAPISSISDNTAYANAPALLQHQVMDAMMGIMAVQNPAAHPADYLATLQPAIETPTARPSIDRYSAAGDRKH